MTAPRHISIRAAKVVRRLGRRFCAENVKMSPIPLPIHKSLTLCNHAFPPPLKEWAAGGKTAEAA